MSVFLKEKFMLAGTDLKGSGAYLLSERRGVHCSALKLSRP